MIFRIFFKYITITRKWFIFFHNFNLFFQHVWERTLYYFNFKQFLIFYSKNYEWRVRNISFILMILSLAQKKGLRKKMNPFPSNLWTIILNVMVHILASQAKKVYMENGTLLNVRKFQKEIALPWIFPKIIEYRKSSLKSKGT